MATALACVTSAEAITPELVAGLHEAGPKYAIAYAGGTFFVVDVSHTEPGAYRTVGGVPIVCHFDRVAARVGDGSLTAELAGALAADLTPVTSST